MTANTGVSLDRYVREKGPLSARQASRIGFLLVQRLRSELAPGAAGRPAPIHPGRILVRGGGEIELAADEDDGQPVAIRLAPWVSPEEAQGIPGDWRSQFYSLGCTLFDAVTGSPPFPGDDPKEILRAHARQPIPDPRERVASIDEGFVHLLTDLLNKDPALRLCDLATLARSLKSSSTAPGGGTSKAAPAGPSSPKSRAPAPASPPRSRETAPRTRRAGGAAPGRVRSRAPAERAERPRVSRAERGQSRPGRPARARRSARAPEFEDGSEEGEPRRRPRRTFAFTWIGLGVGTLLTLLLFAWQRSKGEANVTERATRIAEMEQAIQVASRDQFMSRITLEAENDARVTQEATNVTSDPNLPSAEKRRRLMALVEARLPSPGVKQLVSLYDASRDPAAEEGGDPDVLAQKEFLAATSEIAALRNSKRYAAALARAREAERNVGLAHGDEIRRMIDEISEEVAKRFEQDRARVGELLGSNSLEQAADLVGEMKAYGTAEMRREAEALERTVRGRLLAAENAAERTSNTGENEGDGNDPVDALFEKFYASEGGGSAAEEDTDGDSPDEDAIADDSGDLSADADSAGASGGEPEDEEEF